jgi:hypothetical protein
VTQTDARIGAMRAFLELAQSAGDLLALPSTADAFT